MAKIFLAQKKFLMVNSRPLGKAAVFVIVVALSFYCSQESHNNAFFFRRTEALSGSHWLLLTGHFSHINTPHLLLNLAAWTLVWLYGWKVCSGPIWSVLFAVSVLGTSLGLLFLVHVDWYAGLSGILHGLLIAVVLLRLCRDHYDYSAWLLLLIIGVKLIYEYLSPTALYTADLINVPVLSEAHLLGFISGLLSWLLVVGLSSWLKRPL